MKHLVAAVLVVMSLAFANDAVAFGVPSVPSVKGGGATGADVDLFIAAVKTGDEKMSNAVGSMYAAVSSQEEVANYKAQLQAIEAMPDGKEKDAKKLDLQKTAEAKVEEAAKKKEQASVEMKAALLSAGKEMTRAVGLDAAAVLLGKKLVSGVPSPDVAPRLPLVKDLLQGTVAQMDSATKMLGATKQLLTPAQVEELAKASAGSASSGGI